MGTSVPHLSFSLQGEGTQLTVLRTLFRPRALFAGAASATIGTIAPRARARRNTPVIGARSLPPGIRECGRRPAAHSRTASVARRRRRRAPPAPCAAASVESVRVVRAGPTRPAVRRLRPWPSPRCGTAATGPPHWLADSAKPPSRPASRPDSARRNRRDRRRGRRRLVATGASCLRRPQVPARAEPLVPPTRRVAQQLRAAAMPRRLPVEAMLPPQVGTAPRRRVVAMLRRPLEVPALPPLAPRSQSVAAKSRQAPSCRPARLWRHCA
jgi:hypothetical protein